MARGPVTVFLGARIVQIPWAAFVVSLLVVVAGVLAALANTVAPAMLGAAPLVPLPDPLQTAANLIGYLAAMAALIAGLLWLFAHWEAFLAGRGLRGTMRLVPLAALPARGVTLAPNRDPEDRRRILVALEDLAARGDVTAVLAVVDADDAADGSTSRLLVTVSAPARRARSLLRAVPSDGVSPVGPRERAHYRHRGAPATGTMWLVVWD